MERNAWILGLSQRRIGFAAGLLVPLVFLAVIAIRGSKDRIRLKAWAARTADHLGRGSRHFNLLSVLIFAALLGTSAVLFFSSPILDVGDAHRAVFTRASPALTWATLAAAQAAAALVIAFPGVVKKRGYLTGAALGRSVLVGLLVVGALVQWAILYFRLDVFSQITHWYWQPRVKGGTEDWLFVPLTLGALVLAKAILEWTRSTWLRAALLILLGYLLQIGFGMVEGNGLLSLKDRYLDGGRPIYSSIVTDSSFTWNSILDYEALYGDDYFLGRKPPGYLTAYALTNVLVNPRTTSISHEARIQRLATFMAVSYPLLALAVIPALLSLGSHLLGEADAPVPSLALISFPGFILFTLQLDQVLFPLLSTLALYPVISAADRESLPPRVLAGLMAFVALFFSFTLLPLLILIPLWELISCLYLKRGTWLNALARRAVGFALGLLLGYVAFRIAIGYDIVTRIRNVVSVFGAGGQSIPNSINTLKDAVLLDSAEMAIWLGFPTVLILLVQLIRGWSASIRRVPTKPDTLSVSMVVLLAILAGVAPTRGEVARLGLFLLPMFSLLVAQGLRGLWEGKATPVYVFLGSQWVTTLLILKFQFPWQ
jgi:hypothetical protein